MLGSLLLFGIYYYVFIGPFFPNSYGKLGHDYAKDLPWLLSGYYWFLQNGLFSIPWFTPAFSGGFLLAAHPRSLYFSVPQLLSFYMDPLVAVKVSVLIGAIMGFLGFYLVLRRVFSYSLNTSFFMATLFLFNSFYAYRMVIGHLNYHSYMVVPIILLCIGWPRAQFSLRKEVMLVIMAAMSLSYILLSGNLNLLAPIFVIIVGFIFYLTLHKNHKNHKDNKDNKKFSRVLWQRFIASAVLFLVFSAFKLSMIIKVMSFFTRDNYLLPGYASILDSIRIPFQSLFFGPPADAFQQMTNVQWKASRHEFEYFISIIPLGICMWGIYEGFKKRLCNITSNVLHMRQYLKFSFLKVNLFKFTKTNGLMMGGLCGILMIPILLNLYTPEWNKLLKTLPLLKSSSLLVRWYCIYIPFILLFTAQIWDQITLRESIKNSCLIVGIAMTLVFHMSMDRSFYEAQNFDPSFIHLGYDEAKKSQKPPPIKWIASKINIKKQGRNILVKKDNLFVFGVSSLNSYESLLGYRLEHFPKKTLRPGKILEVTGTVYNIKNPVSYLFPKENKLELGAHFTLDQKEDMLAFAQYKPYNYRFPKYQVILNGISGVMWMIGILCIVIGLFIKLRQLVLRLRNRHI